MAAVDELDRRHVLVVFTVAIGNFDARGKNVGLLHPAPDTSEVAPAYDTVPTALWSELPTRAAMYVNGKEEQPAVTGADLAIEAAHRWKGTTIPALGLPEGWWARGDLNPHVRRHTDLKGVRRSQRVSANPTEVAPTWRYASRVVPGIPPDSTPFYQERVRSVFVSGPFASRLRGVVEGDHLAGSAAVGAGQRPHLVEVRAVQVVVEAPVVLAEDLQPTFPGHAVPPLEPIQLLADLVQDNSTAADLDAPAASRARLLCRRHLPGLHDGSRLGRLGCHRLRATHSSLGSGHSLTFSLTESPS